MSGYPTGIDVRGDAPPVLWRGWVLIFLGTFLLYAFTACDQIQWLDSGEFVLRVVNHELNIPGDSVRAHPLHFWLCTAFASMLPLKPPFAMALVSALGGALTVANVYAVVKLLSRRNDAAILAALGLALAHSFWRFSGYVEVYTLTAASLTAEMWALVEWDLKRRPKWLVLMFLANGIGLANHDLALLSLPVSGIVLLIALFRRETGWGTAWLGLLAWLVGASPFLGLVAYEAYHLTAVEAIHSALVGKWAGEIAGEHLLLTYFATSLAFTALSFPNLMLPAAVLGVIRGRRRVPPISYFALTAATAIQLIFVLRYGVIDQYTFLVPVYALIAVLSGLGFAVMMTTWPPRARRWVIGVSVASVLLTPLVYISAAKVTRHFHLLGRYARHKPYRDDYRYLFLPWGRGENSAELMSRQAMDLAGPDGMIIVEDAMGGFAVRYQLHMADRPNVRYADGADPALIRQYAAGHRPVVLVPLSVLAPPAPPPVGSWRRVGDIFILDAGSSTAPASRPQAVLR
jgi:hypothetical protein